VQTNRSGANLPATIEKAMELLLPLQPTEPPKPKAALPVSAEDASRNAGVYQNGDQRLEILAKGNQLFLNREGGAEAPLVKHTEVRYAVEGRTAAEFVMVAGADGKTEYVHSGSRSFARVR